MGSSCAARLAGKQPKITPTAAENKNATLVDDNNGFGNAQGGEFDTTNDNNGFGNSQDGEFGGTSKRTGTASLTDTEGPF